MLPMHVALTILAPLCDPCGAMIREAYGSFTTNMGFVGYISSDLLGVSPSRDNNQQACGSSVKSLDGTPRSMSSSLDHEV
jgi:hypothetical protein